VPEGSGRRKPYLRQPCAAGRNFALAKIVVAHYFKGMTRKTKRQRVKPHGETLREYLADEKLSGNRLAATLGVTASTINRLLRYPDRFPTLVLALMIEEVTGGRVAVRSYLPPDKTLREVFAQQAENRLIPRTTRLIRDAEGQRAA
jgi:transcriptional regulator with XRE-family HTH domain